MSNSKQLDTDPSSVERNTPLMAAAAVVNSPISRTLAITAAISLVAFALYMSSHPQTHLLSTQTAAHRPAAEASPRGKSAPPLAANAASDPSRPAEDSSSPKTTVTVNGKDIPASPDGTVDKTVKDGDSTTTVHVSSDGSNTATSTVNVQSNATSSFSSGGGT